MMSVPVDKLKRGLARLAAVVLHSGGRASLAMLVAAGVTAGILFWLTYPRSAPTQPATVNIAAGDDLHAVYANSEDVAEGSRLANASCSGCHGANGISTTADVPHLAGQRPAYLYLELRVYQSGGRGDNPMNNAVKFLSDDALFKVAAYYSSLDPPQPAAPDGTKRADADPVEAGKAAAAACAGCHGETGISKMPGTPSLVGLDPQYLVTAMQAYKGGQRKNPVMAAFVAGIADVDMKNLALFYALQTPGAPQAPGLGNATAGKAAVAACSGCHGNQGISVNPAIPSLAGQDAEYLAAALAAYKNGSRDEATMKGLMAGLDETAIKDLAAFYATQQAQPPHVRKPLTTAEWAQRCDRCHGINGNSIDPRSPALAAQRTDYLEKVLHAYRTGARKSPQMAAMSAAVTEDDVEKLAAYYARQQARAFVYVIVPPK
jgi:cytochrome c553